MKPWLQLFRVGLAGTALSNLLVGYFVALGSAPVDAVSLGSGLVMAFALYCFGMGLNDYCDRHRDSVLYPDRPLPSGALPVGATRIALLGLFVLALSLGFATSRSAGLAVLHVGAWIMLYNTTAKHSSWLGPLSMGAVRAALVLLGMILAQPSQTEGGVAFELKLATACVVGGYVALLTWFSMTEESTIRRARQRHFIASSFVLMVAPAGVLMTWSSGYGAGGAGAWLRASAWLPFVAWVTLYARRPLFSSPSKPGLTTYRMLLGLFLLDLAILLSYDRLGVACIPAMLWLWRWRPFIPKRV